MNAFRPTILQMRGYTPGEQPQDRRYVKLNTNENPYPPSPRAIEAVRAAAGADMRLYPDPLAGDLRRAAADLYGVDADQVLVGNGSDDLLTILFRTCVGRGDRAAYPVPTYSLYDTLVRLQDGEAVRPAFGGDFVLPEAIDAAGARLTIICNPNSPSGTLTPIERLERLAERVDGLLVVDEAYIDFAEEKATALPLLRRHQNVVVLRTLSKSYSLAGMRIGLGFAVPAVIGELCKAKDSYNISRTSIAAGAAALQDQEHMRANVARIRRTREHLIAELGQLGYAVPPSQANFVLARRAGRRPGAGIPRLEGARCSGALLRHPRPLRRPPHQRRHRRGGRAAAVGPARGVAQGARLAWPPRLFDLYLRPGRRRSRAGYFAGVLAAARVGVGCTMKSRRCLSTRFST